MNTNLVDEIKKLKSVEAPQWAPFVKTGSHRERPPVNPDWWFVRTASVLSKIDKFGPIGTNKLSKQYGGRKNRGHKPDVKCVASRNIIRKCIQQLEKEGLIKQISTPASGKVITKEGRELLKKVNK